MPNANDERTIQYMVALCKHIRKGRLDTHLDTIKQTINKRQVLVREEKAEVNLILLKPGTRVRIETERIKPQYLGGLKGTVIDAAEVGRLPRSQGHRVAIPIRLDDGRVRKYGPIIFVPAACLAKLKDQSPHPDHGYTEKNE